MEMYLKSVRQETAKILSINESAISNNSSLINDLEADSLDIIDLTYSLAQKLKIVMPTASLYEHTINLLDQEELSMLFDDHKLTPLAKKFFAASHYKYTPEQLERIENLGDIYAETSVYNWASLCKYVAESEGKVADELLTQYIKDFKIE